MVTPIEITVPDIGDFKDVEIIELPAPTGTTVSIDDTIAVLESDKATLDVPTPTPGQVVELRVAVGDTVSQGDIILTISPEPKSPGSASSAEPAAGGPAAESTKLQLVSAPPMRSADVPPPGGTTAPRAPRAPGRTADLASAPHASPSVRRFARDLGVDPRDVRGTGRKGRILKADVSAYVKDRLARGPSTAGLDVAPWPKVDFEKFGEVERIALSRIAKISGRALARNAVVIPHVTNFEKTDITELEAFRKEVNTELRNDGVKTTILAFVVKAVVGALKAYPKFNSSLDGEEIVLKKYYNIGVAADTPQGLVVPVVKAANEKGIVDIAREMADLATKARQGSLHPTDMQGATFTISSLGGIGGTNFTPIINAPEVAILGLVRAEVQPVWRNDAVVPRLIQPMSLSWDHRVVDGVEAARFLVHMKRSLNDFRRLML